MSKGLKNPASFGGGLKRADKFSKSRPKKARQFHLDGFSASTFLKING
jgi:hypothetical protein